MLSVKKMANKLLCVELFDQMNYNVRSYYLLSFLIEAVFSLRVTGVTNFVLL